MSGLEAPKAEPISLEDSHRAQRGDCGPRARRHPVGIGLGRIEGGPENLGAITQRLRREMERGSSLVDALKNCGAEFPPSYLALVEAGLKSNRLSDALISAAAFARTVLEIQRSLRSTLVYPVIVLCVAYAFFLVLLTDLLPRIIHMMTEVRFTPDSLLLALRFLSQTVIYWGPALPIVVVIMAIWTGLLPLGASQRPTAVIGRLRFLPWIGRIVNDVQSASFCHLLSLLVEREVPLPEALEVAGTASADSRLARECREIAAGLRKGLPLGQVLKTSRRLPAFTRWMLAAGQTQGALPAVMATLGDVYRLRARSRIELFRMSAPLILTTVLGGGAVAAYAFLLFVPMRDLFLQLTDSAR